MVTILPQSVDFFLGVMTYDSTILAQVLYQDQGIVQLIGDMICPNKKCRGERCVFLGASKKSTRASTNVSNAKLPVACSIFLLCIRNHVLFYLVGPTALQNRKIWITKKRNSRL